MRMYGLTRSLLYVFVFVCARVQVACGRGKPIVMRAVAVEPLGRLQPTSAAVAQRLSLPHYPGGGAHSVAMQRAGEWMEQQNTITSSCYKQQLIREEPERVGSLESGLGKFRDEWSEGATIKFEWVEMPMFDTNEEKLFVYSRYIAFKTSANPFVDRTGNTNGHKDNNQLFKLSDFATNDVLLKNWTQSGRGAYLCLGNLGGHDTAWAIIPKNNADWEIGCSAGGWKGRGAYYSGADRPGGWVGVKDKGQVKSGTGETVGLTISIETGTSCQANIVKPPVEKSAKPSSSPPVEKSAKPSSSNRILLSSSLVLFLLHRVWL